MTFCFCVAIRTLVATFTFLFFTFSAYASRYPITVVGADENSFQYQLPLKKINQDPQKYDAIIVGGGPAGLTAAVFLSDAGKKVLLLEKEGELGGLAQGEKSQHGWDYATGAAYFTYSGIEEDQILEHIGFKNYRDTLAIQEPIDSYFWNGVLYEEVWGKKSLSELPTSFELFKYELLNADHNKEIPELPIEDFKNLTLDQMTAETWIKSMPAQISLRSDPQAQSIYARFLLDPKVDHSQPMKDVIDFLSLYCRSALGTLPTQISAAAFANFYISEVEARYATPTGTGGIAKKMVEIIKSRPSQVTTQVDAQVVQIKSARNNPSVTYVKNQNTFNAQGSFVIFAAPLKLIPNLIENFSENAPEQFKIIQNLKYAHYTIHNLFMNGHPYRASYDTWVRAQDYTENDFADLILGRWMDPNIHGYENYRDFKIDPQDQNNVLSLYHPLSLEEVGKGYTREQAIQTAQKAVDRFQEIFSPFLKKRWGTHIDIQSVETHRWPYSIHIVEPGHLEFNSKILRKPFGKIFFANNNVGAPSLEEALFRGHCAANNILARLNTNFAQEQWTKCQIE